MNLFYDRSKYNIINNIRTTYHISFKNSSTYKYRNKTAKSHCVIIGCEKCGFQKQSMFDK